ncbi:MAG: phosphatase PAP2 family protein [Acinetobacter sp.]
MLSYFNHLNFFIFELIYSSWRSNEFLFHFALFSSHYLTKIIAVILLALAIFKSRYRILFVKALILTLLTSVISYILDHTLHFPRPFALGLGDNHIDHSNSSSFPSSHMMVISTIAFAYLFSSQKNIGWVLLCAAFAIGWSRIYLGVHFPYDIFGSFIIALVVNYLVHIKLKKFPQLIG